MSRPLPRAAAALLLLFPLLAVACQPPLISAAAEDRPIPAASELTTAPLAIVTGKGAFSFVVEIARSEAEQAQGLKHRRPLAPDRGMIFPMRPARLASFWMKDTPSPLDIIFIAPGGTVARVAAMTKPYSLDPIDSGVPVEAVLEIAGGRAEQIGLQPGDRVNWRDPGGE
ncbi:DUF192 domain-containing protein [Tardibacter chloracetimidivorans]|uniref:DUF192 domain-containing protein n=1 Tax=Tardibacter chloracetimidivorans TaxID=1921510 RepID=UPI0009F8F40E|nr:DUF192 domain-containing protein [Tardibacter chloracetimidivorans]